MSTVEQFGERISLQLNVFLLGNGDASMVDYVYTHDNNMFRNVMNKLVHMCKHTYNIVYLCSGYGVNKTVFIQIARRLFETIKYYYLRVVNHFHSTVRT